MRPAQKIIDLNALRHNAQQLKRQAAVDGKSRQFIAVLKADAYGCGAIDCARALAKEADLFAVAEIGEALEIRQSGSTKPIVLLEGVFSEDEIALAYAEQFELVVATPQQLAWLLAFSKKTANKFARVWLKLDTGMGRLGFFADEVAAVMAKLKTHYAESEIVLISHFAGADEPDASAAKQLAVFVSVAARYPQAKCCLANSAAILRLPQARADFVRAGIALYGVSPFMATFTEGEQLFTNTATAYQLRPVMRLTSAVISVKYFKKGALIGYGGHGVMPHDGYVAMVAMGYADGYLRAIPTGAPIWILGKTYPILGRIAMDMTAVLVDETVRVGDAVECFGKHIAIETLSALAGTIPHQILTTVGKRPKRLLLE